MNDGFITMFTSEHCGFCKRAVDFFTEKGLDKKYVKIDVDSPTNNAVKVLSTKYDNIGVPIFYYNGEYLRGFNPPDVEAFLVKHGFLPQAAPK